MAGCAGRLYLVTCKGGLQGAPSPGKAESRRPGLQQVRCTPQGRELGGCVCVCVQRRLPPWVPTSTFLAPGRDAVMHADGLLPPSLQARPTAGVGEAQLEGPSSQVQRRQGGASVSSHMQVPEGLPRMPLCLFLV